MNEGTCGIARELLPDLASGRLDADTSATVDAHLSACTECRDELALVRALRGSRVPAPSGLAVRISHAVRRDRRRSHRPWWGISAAAVAALALGIGMASEPTTSAVPELAPPFASDDETEAELWLSEDGLVAGAPALESLSDEALLQLVDELSAGTNGGAV
jgi:anti-sigma factor RsiW